MLNGVLAGHTEEEVNLVNAPALAEERGIEVSERTRDRARATSPTSCASRSSAAASARASSARRSASCTARTCSRPGASASTSRSTRRHLALFRYSDVPGMVGRVGTVLGEHGVNISAAAVGREPPGRRRRRPADLAVMAVTTDAPVPHAVVDEIVASDGFVAGRAVALAG